MSSTKQYPNPLAGVCTDRLYSTEIERNVLTKIALIGDVHGKIPEYLKIRAQYKRSLQIGDMGLGFPGISFPHKKGHSFIRGNHDDPEASRSHKSYAKDYGMWEGIFLVAGADSIDKTYRTPGLSWWADEQLNREDMELMTEEYAKAKPDFVVTHEAPFRLHSFLKEAAAIRDPNTAAWGPSKGNSTAFALDDLFTIHKPKVWVFGHWHCDLTFNLKKSLKTVFVCVDELSVYELEL